MAYRNRYLANQLGKKIKDPGAHMPHAAVALIRRRNSKANGFNEKLEMKKSGQGQDIKKSHNPFPLEFLPSSM